MTMQVARDEPQTGSAAARAPRVPGLDTDAWQLPGAEILQLVYEIDGPAGEQSIPPALHPSIPPYATLTIAPPFSPIHAW